MTVVDGMTADAADAFTVLYRGDSGILSFHKVFDTVNNLGRWLRSGLGPIGSCLRNAIFHVTQSHL